MLRISLVISLLVGLTACSSTSDWKGIYSAEAEAKNQYGLDVPPDLSSPNVTDALALPNIATRNSNYSNYKNITTTGNTVTPANPIGVKVIRDGATQWLEIESSAEKLWPQLKAFFQQVGFEVKREDKATGIIETNWLESKAMLPTGWFSKMLNRISSTGLRDKYRARVEKTNKTNVIRVFITHQGLKEYATDEINGVKIWWQPRPSDPELEAEMYQRFLIFRDISKEDALKIVKKSIDRERTKIIDKDETKVLQVGEGFARTWRRVGIALDRIGLLVDDRDRSGGLYYLKITEDFRNKVKDTKEDSWLAGLFSSNEVKLKQRYLLSISDEGETCTISLYETTGAKADIRFVEKLLKDLKRYLD
ncbi:MAG: outer membrane protein assembly factor BamC [Woeseiaceae bacterium]